MNKRLKAMWVKALRSGEYPQGGGVMLSDSGKYCCLGVLCAVAGADPKEILNIGYPIDTSRFQSIINHADARALASLNDSTSVARVPFEMIAGVIDAYL